jgi:transposase-like protein
MTKEAYRRSGREKGLWVSYPTAWLMLHKIRRAMGERESRYLLAGVVETDETYIGSGKEGGKRGRGTEKIPVQVAVSLNADGEPQFVKMEMLDDITSQTIRRFAGRHIAKDAIIKTDKYRSYIKAFEEQEYIHESKRFDVKENPEHLKWLHRIVWNMKAFILGTYHGLGGKHLSAYLNEFCFRFNRRHFSGQLFNRLLNACMASEPFTYRDLTSPVLT